MKNLLIFLFTIISFLNFGQVSIDFTPTTSTVTAGTLTVGTSSNSTTSASGYKQFTWVPPAGVTSVRVEVWGGGGGGCGRTGSSYAGAGGGGGAYARKISYTVVGGTTVLAIQVGYGGAAANSGNNTAGAGGTSYVKVTNHTGTVIASAGGGGGGINGSTSVTGGSGSTTRTISGTAPTTNDNWWGGGAGGGGAGSAGRGAGGGGGAGSGGSGGAGATCNSGTGNGGIAGIALSTPFVGLAGGTGGGCTGTNNGGTVGGDRGAGGGGSGTGSTTAGGAGGGGFVRITYTITTPSCASTPTPTNTSTGVSTSQVLSWSSVAGATGYDVYFGTSATPPLVSTNQSGTSYTPTLSNSTTYYWKVVPKNSAGSASSCSTWSFTTVAPAPANDLCSGATSLPCGTSGLAGTTVGTVSESAPQSLSSNFGVWYTFVGDGSSTTITIVQSLDTRLLVMSASGCGGPYTTVANVDNTTSSNETTTFTATNGTKYYVYIAYYSTSGTSSNTGTFTISRSCVSPPINDACANATSLPCGTSSLAGTTVGSSYETSPNSLYVGGYGVWYTFVGDGQETTITTTSSIDLGMYVGYGSCAGLTEVISVDDAGAGGTETTTFVATNSTTYYVYVGYYGVSVITGTFTISRSCTPAYTPCSSITSLNCGSSTTFTVTSGNGGWDPIVSSCGYSTPGKEYIFQFTPSITGNYTLSQPSSFDYIDWFYKASSGGCNNTGWTCIDDISTLDLGNDDVNIPLTAGTTYYLMADPESTIGGSVTFTLNCACNTPTTSGTLTVSPSNTGTVNDAFTYTTTGNDGTITSLEYSYNNFTSVAGTFTYPVNPFDLILNSYQPQVWVRTTSVNGLCPAGTTTPVLVTLQLAPPYTIGTSSGDYITNVTLNNLNNNSTYDTPLGDSYQDFTSLSANVDRGATYNLSVTATQTGSAYQGYAVWIDYNNNGTFEVTENVMLKSPLSLTQSQSITIPTDATVGLVKMRVLSRRNGTPTTDAYNSVGYNRGEIEEYKVNIQSALPIELSKFDGINQGENNYIFWVTASEQNTSHFNLQKSRDGESWTTITTLSAAGNSNTQIDYDVVDYKVDPIINYYRLQQYDNDGVYETFGPIAINNMDLGSQKTIVKCINLNGQEVDPTKLKSMDVYIEVYDDGTMKKVIK